MEWIKGDLNDMQGYINCPQCNLGLGGWDWEGALISDTTKVVPSFRLHKATLCLISKKSGGKSKEKVTKGRSGWADFMSQHPLGYPPRFLPSASAPLSPRRNGSSEPLNDSDGEKDREKKKENGTKTPPHRKAPGPPQKKSGKVSFTFLPFPFLFPPRPASLSFPLHHSKKILLKPPKLHFSMVT